MGEYSDVLFLHGVSFEIVVLRTSLVKDKLFLFGDFQEDAQINSEIFDYAISMLTALNYDISDAISISSGDMYGESNKRISLKVKGTSGIPEYELYNRTSKLYYVYGNHDHILEHNIENVYPINEPFRCINGTTIFGFHGIQSSKNNYPYQYPSYDDDVSNALKKNQKIDIIVTHETPKLNDLSMNPRCIGNQKLHESILSYKQKIHMFGHCHLQKSHHFQDDIMYINTDSRFVLLLPE